MNPAPTPRLYADLAHLWPLLSPPEDYASEAEIVREILEDQLGEPGEPGEPGGPSGARRSILELGAGGGHTLYHLRDTFDAVAVDLSPAMLAHCRQLNPGIETVVGDMRSIRLGRTFDAVLIHDAIDYMTSEADVRAAMATAAAHLAPGGVVLIAPTYVRETFTDHAVEHDQRETPAGMLTYFSYVHDPDPTDEMFELVLVYLMEEVERGRAVRVEHDRHTCGLFDVETWLRLLDEAGFDAELAGEENEDDDGVWTLFVGVQRGNTHF